MTKHLHLFISSIDYIVTKNHLFNKGAYLFKFKLNLIIKQKQFYINTIKSLDN
ncbi:Uncharacterised protein [Staphylococcus pseudintermedius]|nr:Uncharacterised protein [Staphylococcus pseudintermedius]